jgi:PcfJ-like protein
MPFQPAAAKQMADAAIHDCLRRRPDMRGTFLTLVHSVQARSQILSPRWYRNHRGENGIARVVEMLLRVAEQVDSWQRPLVEWCAPAASQYVQVRSLVDHLFAEYSVPGFMTKVWLLGDKYSDAWQRKLFLHLGRGRSVRAFPMQIPVTKAMARHFMAAPDDLTVPQAVRWSQVMACGGGEALAKAVVGTCLSNFTSDEEFWATVVRFLVKYSPMAATDVEAIVHFVDQQRHQPAHVVLGVGVDSRPLQPEFSLRGRTLRSLQRYMARWRDEILPKLTGFGAEQKRWERTGIGSFRGTESEQTWTIEELLSDRELRIEGSMMKHCVAWYISCCSRRRTSIWSMKVDDGQRRKRVLTIEVNPWTKVVRQARGKHNASPDEASRSMLQRWARQEGLRL